MIPESMDSGINLGNYGMQKPNVELSDCILCEICTELSPKIFKLNELGYIEVAESETYPVAEVDEAIKNCPANCIVWGDDT